MRKVVLLPQPEGPTSTMNSLSVMSRSMPRTARTSSYFLTTLTQRYLSHCPLPFGSYPLVAPAVRPAM